MPLAQFSIILDNPSMSYFPGQLVTGRVVINAHSEKKSQGLKLKFTGVAKVHWTEEHTEWHGTGEERQQRKVTKNYDDQESFFEFKSYLLGDGRSDSYIPMGENFYPFTFQLPPMNIPSSYNGQHGKVEYFLEAEVKRAWKFDYETKQYITVNAIVDLNNDPVAADPVHMQTSKTFCCLCCASGPLSLVCNLKTKGYVPGEAVGLTVEVNNQSTRRVNDIKTKIVQDAKFFAEGKTKHVTTAIIKQSRGQGSEEDPDESDVWRCELRLPPVPPTKLGGCRIIDVQYTLDVEVDVTNGLNLSLNCPLIIGTVPLRTKFDELQALNTAPIMPAVPSAPPMFTPNGYPDLPLPRFQDSHDFKGEPHTPNNLVDNITNQVVDNIAPPQPDYVPKYVTYGWNFNIPPQQMY